MTALQLAPRSSKPRFFSGSTSRLPGDLWLIEVEYVDARGRTRREFLADVIHDADVHRFALGSSWQVFGFVEARGRCLLTEPRDDIPRVGVHLDGVRFRTDRQVQPPRSGSPILGAMRFTGDNGHGFGPRTSWPGDLEKMWAYACAAPEAIARPRPVPEVTTTGQVARWEGPDGFAKIMTYWAPIFWVILPLAAMGFLVFVMNSEPDTDFPVGPAWVVVSVWLLIAVGVLVFRVRMYPNWDREDAARILTNGVLCEVHWSPFETPGAMVRRLRDEPSSPHRCRTRARRGS